MQKYVITKNAKNWLSNPVEYNIWESLGYSKVLLTNPSGHLLL